jgi:hypothetical protein
MKPGFAFRSHITFTVERNCLKELDEELREDRLSLKTIVAGLKSQQEYTTITPSGHSRRLTKFFAQVHSNATPLLNAICQSYKCKCKCENNHKALMRLDSRASMQPARPRLGGRSQQKTTFSLLFDVQGFLQESLIEASQPKEPTNALDDTYDPCVTAVSLPSIVLTGADRSFHEDTLKTKNDDLNLCRLTLQAKAAGRILRMELDGNNLSALNVQSRQRQQYSSAIALGSMLQKGHLNEEIRMTPKQQTLLALDLASSVLQLRETTWVGPAFSSKTIRLLTKHSKETAAVVSGPYIEQVVDEESVGGWIASEGPDPKAALLELAILLLEIWNHRPVEVWSVNTDIGTLDTTDSRRAAAIRWLELTSDRLPPHHLTAIEQCLAICAGRVRT